MKTTLAEVTNPVIGSLGTGGISSGGTNTARLIATAIRILVVMGGILMILYLILGGINWITAEGKPDKLEKSRNQIVQAITGMIILAGTIAITSFLGAAFDINLLNINLPGVSGN